MCYNFNSVLRIWEWLKCRHSVFESWRMHTFTCPQIKELSLMTPGKWEGTQIRKQSTQPVCSLYLSVSGLFRAVYNQVSLWFFFCFVWLMNWNRKALAPLMALLYSDSPTNTSLTEGQLSWFQFRSTITHYLFSNKFVSVLSSESLLSTSSDVMLKASEDLLL